VVTLFHLAWDKEFDSPCVYQIFGKMSVISFCCLRAQMSPERTDEFSRDNLGGKDGSTEILIFTNTVCMQLITDCNRKRAGEGIYLNKECSIRISNLNCPF